MNSVRRRRAVAGFTLVEALVVAAIVGVAALLAGPPLIKLLVRNKLISATRETAVLMQLARLEAIRYSAPTVVRADFANRRVIAWRESVTRNLVQEAGEVALGTVTLPSRVVFWSPTDAGPDGATASTFTGTAPTPAFVAGSSIPGAVYLGDGSVLAVGALRFADEAGVHFLEVNVGPLATGRPSVRKYNPTPPIAGTFWYEPGKVTATGRNAWEWE